MPAQNKQHNNPQVELETPFLEQELFVEESEAEWESHLAVLQAETLFQGMSEEALHSANTVDMETPKRFENQFASEEPGIIQGDDRVRVRNTTGIPWRWICKIIIEDNRRRVVGNGTGVLVSDRHILTAAHVVYDAYKNMHQYTVTVIPAFNDLKEPFGRYSIAKKPKIRKEFNPGVEGHLDWDYALLTLSTAIGRKNFPALKGRSLCYWGSSQCGANSVFARPDPGSLNGKASYTAGYPGGKGGKQLWCASGILNSVHEKRRTMRITADTTGGQSGSPIWVIDNKRYCLVGIAVGTRRGAPFNTVVRVTRELIRQVRTWINEDGDTPSIKEVKELFEPSEINLEVQTDEVNEIVDEENSFDAFAPDEGFDLDEEEYLPELGEGADETEEDEEVEAPYVEGEEEGTYLEEGEEEFFSNKASTFEEKPLTPEIGLTEAEEQEYLEESFFTDEVTAFDEDEIELAGQLPPLFDAELPASEEELAEEGEQPTEPGRSSTIDYQKAIRLNRDYGRQLGWQDRLRNINLLFGLTSDTLEDRDFIDAVASWQRAQGGLVVDGILGPNTWRRMRPELVSVSTAVPPAHPTPLSYSHLRQRIAEIAEKEWVTWGKGTRKETEPGMYEILRKYWRTVRNKDKAENAIRTREAWSAAFVSWVMQEANTGNAFRKSSLHAAYVYEAKRAQENSDYSKFWAYEINEAKPERGDVVVNDRCKRRVRGKCDECFETTFKNVDSRNKKGYLYRKSHGDIVVDIDVSKNRIKVIGGNVNDSVGHKWINLDPKGYLPARTRNGCRYIAIIKPPVRDEPVFEAEQGTNTSCTVFIPRRLPVRFRRNLPDFLDEVVRAVGRFTVFRSDAGRRARSLVVRQELILEEMHRQMLRLGIPDGGHVEVPAIFTYQGQKDGVRCRPQRVMNVTLFDVLDDLSSGGIPI